MINSDPTSSMDNPDPVEPATEHLPEPSTEPSTELSTEPGAATAPDPLADPLANARREEALGSAQRVEQALTALDLGATRVSSSSGGTRFSTLQKTQGALAAELREWRVRASDEGAPAALAGLLEKVERLVAALAPAATEGSASVPATGSGQVRQALIRGMITLAPAPLHLQIEFAPEFPLALADPITLAARSHAVNRAVLGSLRRIQWEAPDRCSLWFGDGEQRRIVAASFDAQGKVEVPPEYRQKQNPPGERRTAASPPSQERRPEGRRRRGAASGGAQTGRPPQQGPAPQGTTQQGSAQQEPSPVSPGETNRPRGGQPRTGQPPAGQPRGRQAREGQPNSGAQRSGPPRPGQPRSGRPGGPPDRQGGRPESRGDGRGRDERPKSPPGRGGGFPANSMMADKLRAALMPAKPAMPSPTTESSSSDAASRAPGGNKGKDKS